MLNYSEIKPRKYIVLEGEPFEVLDSHVFRKQMRKPVNATKLRNLITGKIVEHSFHAMDTVHEADIQTEKLVYIYSKPSREGGKEVWFHKEGDPKERFMIDEQFIGSKLKFLKPNSVVSAERFGEKIIGVTMPIKVALKVTEAPPAVKGNTAQGGSKQITLETGAVINAPLFINEGEIIIVNIESEDYVERQSN